MSRTAVATAGVLALALTVVAAGAPFAQEGEPAAAVTNPNTQEISDTLVPQADAYAVYAEHIRALNACDWVAIMAHYPDTAEIHLSGGTVVKGREAIGELFAGFVLPAAEGGLCGITFTEESFLKVGTTENVQWVA